MQRMARLPMAALRRPITTVLRRWNSTLVLSDGLISKIPPASTQSAVTVACQLGIEDVHLLVIGGDAPAQSPVGVKKVYHIPDKDPTNVDTIKTAIETAVVKNTCTHVIGTSPLLAQVAKQLGAPIADDVVEIVSRDTFLIGDNKMKLQLKEMLKVLAIRPESFDLAPMSQGAPVVEIMKDQSRVSNLAFKAMPPVFLLLVAACFIPMDD